jgi:hypothetical protein
MKTSRMLTVLTLVFFILLIACPSMAGNTDYPAGEEGARQLLMAFFDPGVDKAALTMSLKPDAADYKAYFKGTAVSRAMESYRELWESKPVIGPNPGQTELLLFKATTDELTAGAPAARYFPGGYKKITDKLALGHTVYRFKFVEPGQDLGMAFDGLVHINGHWVIFPKPWRAFR